jgi:hypothetical protein
MDATSYGDLKRLSCCYDVLERDEADKQMRSVGGKAYQKPTLQRVAQYAPSHYLWMSIVQVNGHPRHKITHDEVASSAGKVALLLDVTFQISDKAHVPRRATLSSPACDCDWRWLWHLSSKLLV